MQTRPAEKQRDLARDIRSDTIGEVMATPDEAGVNQFWLRPVGGGYEWPVPRQFIEIIKRAEPEPAAHG